MSLQSSNCICIVFRNVIIIIVLHHPFWRLIINVLPHFDFQFKNSILKNFLESAFCFHYYISAMGPKLYLFFCLFLYMELMKINHYFVILCLSYYVVNHLRTTAGDWDCVVTVKCLPALHHGVDFIFSSFGIIDSILEL